MKRVNLMSGSIKTHVKINVKLDKFGNRGGGGVFT
jgi:hypothetical protein